MRHKTTRGEAISTREHDIRDICRNTQEKESACVMAHDSVQTGWDYARVSDPESTIRRRDEQPDSEDAKR